MERKKTFTFHVHLPENIEKIGQPVVLGDADELGAWKNPIVKLHQKNRTYWKSDPVPISIISSIQYKYAIHIPKSALTYIEFEGFDGIDAGDNRTLDVQRNNQFDIWKIHEFAFVDYIYDSIEINNLRDKVLEYQHLLTIHSDLTIHASNPKFIIDRIDDNIKEKRLFLCVLLGYYISKKREEGSSHELPNNFPSNLLLNTLEDYKQEFLPLDTKDQMHTAIITLIQHNAFQMKFKLDWLIIFTIASEVDPDYTFINHLKALKYSDDKLEKFIEGCKIIKPYTQKIKFESYVEIARWLIQLCHNMDSLLKLWDDILLHNNEFDESVSKCFTEQVRANISHTEAVALERNFKRLPEDYRDRVSGIFRDRVIFLLEGINRKWTYENINAVKKLLHENNLSWHRDEFIQSLELISQSHTLELLNIFPDILDDWFRNDFSDTKEKKIPKICVIWFKNLLLKLDTNTSNKNSSNNSNFIFSVFQQLELMYPLLGRRINIWRDLTAIAIDRVKNYSEDQIFAATKLIVQIKQDNVKVVFLEMVKDMLNKSTLQTHDQLLNKIRIICDCKTTEILDVPNVISEDILYHIMTILQSQSTVSSASEHHLNILKASKFWNIILRATGSVAKLNSNPFVKNIKTSINELAGFLLEKTIDVQLLRQILKYDDEYLFRHFDAAVDKKKALGDVIISRDEIAKLRKIYNNYQTQLDVLTKFYNGFCPIEKVTDVADYIRDVKQHLQTLDKIKVKQVFLSDHWVFHEKTLDSARNCYKFNRSQTFRNIFDACIEKDAAAIKVEYIAQNLIPIVFVKYNAMCIQLKDWEKFKCSEASLLWKNVTDVSSELDLMEGCIISKSQRFVQTLDYLSKIPHWVQRLEELEKVVEMEIFKVPHNEDDWLSKAIRILKDDSMHLGQINNFFDYLDRNFSNVNQDCWKLIKELSNAEDFLIFLKNIAEHDIKNLINGVDDHSDERLIQGDTVSSFIQVKQILFPLMNKNMEAISDLLKELLNVIKKNHTLGEKIALCNSSNMALQNMYNNIQNRGEVTKEKIKNAVINGTFTFTRDQKEDKCLVSLQYPSKFNVKYNLNEILELRGRALLIAKPKISVMINNKEAEMSKDIMDKFVVQVDIAHEIINIVSMLIQMGHFGYRKFENKLQGTDNMKDYLKFLKEELKEWQSIVDRAQQRCYYLTFFLARHILAFYDYFISEKLDKDNEEECKILIRFVNSKAQLPSTRKDIQKILRGSKNYLEILTEIGNELERIFRNVPKQSRKLKATGQHIITDLVRKGEIFVASCTDKTRIPNIIMSLYANHGYYPEPWQLLICTTSTTMEELTNFIKRSLFASNNGYENRLFCIANLELLDFELQFNLINQIKLTRDQEDYFLALICCRGIEMHHHILDQFSSDAYVTNGLNTDAMREIYKELCQNVIRVSSELSGQGKTDWIKEDSLSKEKFTCSFLISDGMDFCRLVRQFKEYKLRPLLTLGIVSTNVDIVCLPLSETPTYIYIEVASNTEQHLLNSLPMTGYLLFNHLTWNIKNLRVSQEIHSPIQVACNYMNLLDNSEIDIKENLFKTHKAIKEPLPVERCQNLIEKYLFNKVTKDISSFRFVEIFINVLADQLVRFSSSQLFTVDKLKLIEEFNITRILILRNFIDVSRDFATNSIKTKEAQLKSTSAVIVDADDEKARRGTIVQWDDSNHLIVFFNSQTPDTISVLYRDRNKVHENIKTLLKSQVIGDQTKWELDDYNSMPSEALLLKLECLARRTTEKLYLPEYALSGDNLIKMALILLRARANIPVIVCGEAGCGKTSLIAYLALIVEVQFMALNLHAGIDERIIMRFMNDALKKAEKGEIWLFFDEINTCNHIGLLADLISRRMLNSKPIHPNIRLFSACNPYRIRTRTQSETGLTNKVKMYEERSHLVYQVKPLPDQILDYVWDYGILKPEDEYRYIHIMVEKELKKLAHPAFAELLYASQKFIRNVEEPYSVSLRDVKRAITLVKFFYNSLEYRPVYKKGRKYPPPGNPTITTRSYVLALSLCYHSRLYDQNLRKQYRREMGQILQNHKAYIGENTFAKIIREEQEDYINRMQCPPNTANNEALLENVLVMIVCILTRIPLFLIGAPGSSKSLAIRLISSNLRGSDSNDKYFRKLPQIYLIPHQGSSSSTSDGIIKVFDKANKYQETTSNQFPVISVVLLDEVGLAEASPFNPLKVLYSLLEPSYPATGPTVSVIGISCWRLDNSKSSRALLVQRPQFSLDDLVDTAERLLNTRVIGYGQRDVLEPLAKAYMDYEKNGQALPNFHGLRDYYALVKRLSLYEMTPENIQMALARNFGGTENNKLYEKYFGNILKKFNNHKPWFYEQIPVEKLINSNLDDPDARHLMVIGKSDSIVNLLTYQLKQRHLDPVVILGSQFPDDQDDYSYSVISRIMMCVEAGRLLILTDLEIIYGNLYDLWNQNYIVVGDKENPKYFTRVALGAYANPILYVSPNFRCIVVMDECNLASANPSLLNQFEKQKLPINDIHNDRQKLLVKYLDSWTKQMLTLIEANSVTQLYNGFTQKDLFIGFDVDETLQSLVFDITRNNPEANDNEILEKCKESLIAIASPDGIIRAELSILDQDEVDRWKYVYFKQHHNSLANYFDVLFYQEKLCADPKEQLVIINTFSKITIDIKSCLQDYLRCQVYNLSTIKTEFQLTNIVKNFFFESNDKVLILQCDNNTINTKCIKLVKYIVEQFRNEFLAKKEKCESNMHIKYTCIIFHIQRDYELSSITSNFICGWKRITIESLEPPEIPLVDLLDKSLYDIINSEFFDKIMNTTMPFKKILQELLLEDHYHSNESHMEYVRTLRKEILNDSYIIQCIKTKTFEWILENHKNWQCEAALNKKDLSIFICFSLTLQNYIEKIIKQTAYKVLYSIEKLPEITRIFKNESNEFKMEKGVHLWKQSFIDKIVNVDDLFELRLSIDLSETINDLEYPFSYYFQINYYKRYYFEELDILTQDSENIKELIEDHIEDFRNSLIFIHPNFDKLQKCSELYYNDFIRIIKLASKEKLDFIFRYLIGDKFVDDPFILHIYWWKYATEILIQLKLVETFPDLITKAQNDFIVYGKLDQFLFKESINLILQNLCDDKPWKQDMDVILLINNCRINDSKNFSNLHLLLLCNDLLNINSVPLEKIKEIIYLGKSAKKQEFITNEIINLVFSNLDNKNDIIPITSFITRSLKLISLESEIHLTLYKNIFSQYSFKLMNNGIIEKIFNNEIQQNEQIFFTLIKNPEEALQLSIRLKTINDNINDINSNMAEFCCEIIQSIFNKFELNELVPYFKNSIESLMKQENLPLQQITSIAFLKEFINKYWKNYFQENNSLSKSLVNEINDIMKINGHLFIQSIQYYSMLDLYKQSSFDIKQLEILKKEFSCFESIAADIEINTFLPKLWKPVRKVNFEDFYTFYISNNLNEYPFLSVFFKHYESLKFIKYLYPIIKFVKILNSKLEYHLTRKAAQIMTFHEFIKKESVDNSEYINLKSLFEEFLFSWNSVISHINQYQSKEFFDKPYMTLDLPVIFGLVEQKDSGIYLYAIVEFLIKLHNEFLNNVMTIPIEKCKSLNFIKDFSWNYLNSKTYFNVLTVVQALDNNFINYEWNDKILRYNQRNLDMKKDVEFIFDLQKIEMKLAKKLVFNKVYFKMENNQFYLKNFSFKHELFHNSPRILFDVKKILSQESILADKMLIISAMLQQSIILNSSSNSINLSELLLLCEIILCFIKELLIRNNNILILDLVNQWLKLARYNITYTDIFKEFSLKHIIAFYELIEEQVANSVIHDIDEKFKISLTQQIMDSINNIIDYDDSENQNQQLIPAKAFVLALKRFIYRFLLIDSGVENMGLYIYFLDFTLNLWTSDMKRELVKKLFPTCLLVSHAYSSYVYLLNEIEKATIERQNKSFASTSSTTRKTLIKKYKKFTD
ncbi:hypothetical protein RhiirC2_849031 [Rhizophagus irregularis]|uniref:AAA+ ATPase domain-containing protein n=1 Tax=Rhizophagus irregularis TaxID=588596 RepID=A0A2N1NCL6_9GLOM|nr:hypothetical protein RhiirC2_849031 [Rhizophagus irregularis]